MAKAEQAIEINATPKQCFEVITDFDRYPEFLKETKSVISSKRTGKTCEVTYTLDLIKTISYTLKMTMNPPTHLQWDLVKGDLMKDNRGEWVLEDTGKGSTVATYRIELNLGLFVPGAISKMLVNNSLPTMLAGFKKRIEEKYSKKGKG